MPHLLIAGATGSGKSVCITALAACLAMNNSPEDLRMVMINSKMVELFASMAYRICTAKWKPTWTDPGRSALGGGGNGASLSSA